MIALDMDSRQRRRWMRNNARLYVRHDAHRFLPVGGPLRREVTKQSRLVQPSLTSSFEDKDFERRELLRLKSELASVRVEIKFHRLLRALKYSPSQPRVPAGNPTGGRWTSAQGGGGGGLGQTIVTEDGSTIQAEYSISPEIDGWDQQFTVELPDGSVTRFQDAGPTQTILDGDGNRLAESTWTSSGPEPQAIVQPAFYDPRSFAVQKSIEAGALLYTWMSNRDGPDSTAVFAFRADEFLPGDDKTSPAIHVRELTRDEVDQACPRHAEVQSIANQVATFTHRGEYESAQAYGTAVHMKIRDEINGPPTVPPSPPRDPDFRAEVSVLKSMEVRYGDKDSKRIDVYENPRNGTVCVYDIKTGESLLTLPRMAELAKQVAFLYPGTQRIIVTETRPGR